MSQCGVAVEGDVLLELAAHDIREDLELAVRVRAEARLGLDAILVDDPEATIVHVPGVLISKS